MKYELESHSSERPLQILLLEDNPDDAALLEAELQLEGLVINFIRVDSRENFEAHLRPEIDLILSDHALPEFNALEALQLVKQRKFDIPFIIVSGAISEDLAVEAMRRGAADYVLKDRRARLSQAVRSALLEHQHRKATEIVEETNRRLAAIVACSTDAILSLALDGSINSWNQGAERLYGYTAGDVVGKSLDLIFPPSQKEEFHLILERVRSGESITNLETAGVTKGGRLLDISFTISPLQDASGRIMGAALIGHDISRRKQAQEALQESEERWRLLFETNPEPTFISFQDVIEHGNAAFVALLGARSMESVAGQSIGRFVASQDQDRLAEWIETLRRGESIPSREFRIVGLEGREHYIELFSAPVTLQGRRVTQTVVRDLTEQKQYESQLIEARDRAREMSRLKSSILTNMSHEIRTPLTGILGFAEVLTERASGETREFMEMIHESGTRLMETLNSVLELAQLDAGAVVVRLEPVDLGYQVRTTLNLFAPQIKKSTLNVITHLPEDPLFVSADRSSLDRALANLISNAIKFTRRGNITVTVDSDGSYGRVHIQDTGVGISPEFLPRLFEEFRQESSGVARDFEGAGLGLTITRRLVELMHGKILVDSVKGQGSTFTVLLPLSARPDEMRQAKSGHEKDLPPAGLRILVVEDHRETRNLFQRILAPPFRLHLSASAEEALEAVARSNFDLIILDENLGVQSGHELLQTIRTMPGGRKVPVLVCTAYSLHGDEKRFLQVGFDDYLSKPFTKAQLFSAINRATSI